MSMHLCGPGLTTTSYKKRKQKVTKAQQEDLERGWRERNVRLKQMGLVKETFEQYLEWVYGKGKKEKKEKMQARSENTKTNAVVYFEAKIQKWPEEVGSRESGHDTTNNAKLITARIVPWITGPCTIKQTPLYTGTKIIGIGTMHKSNLVPIFSDQAAIDISRMRR